MTIALLDVAFGAVAFGAVGYDALAEVEPACLTGARSFADRGQRRAPQQCRRPTIDWSTPLAEERARREETAIASDTSARYKLSFSVGGLYLRSAPVAASLYAELGDWSKVRAGLDAGNLLQARTVSSAKRISRELVQRLREFTDAELSLLIEASSPERAQLLWAATCRRYTLIAEFAEEVLRERFLLMAQDLRPEHFEAFIRGKTLWHPELGELEQSTVRKLRTTLFLMLREGDFITANGLIVPTVLSERVRRELSKHRPSDVRLFATREVA